MYGGVSMAGFSERDVEDWVTENPWLVSGCGEGDVVGRQLRLPSGKILDVLISGLDPMSEERNPKLWVVEVKLGRISTDAVKQAVEYAHEIRAITKNTVDVSVVLVGSHIGPKVKCIVDEMPSVSWLAYEFDLRDSDESPSLVDRARTVSVGERTLTDPDGPNKGAYKAFADMIEACVSEVGSPEGVAA